MIDPFKLAPAVRKRAPVMYRRPVEVACKKLVAEVEIWLDTLMESERWRIILSPERYVRDA